MLGIHVGESLETAQIFVSNNGITYPVLRDLNAAVIRQYPVSGISPYPVDCIIDQSGIVRYLHTEYDPQTMLQIIDNLLLTEIHEGHVSKRLPSTFDLRVYPNPFNPILNVNFTNPEQGRVVLEIYDISGRKILSEEFKNVRKNERIEYTINRKDQASGIYLLSIHNKKIRETVKVILVK
jgi:hypothetical protein